MRYALIGTGRMGRAIEVEAARRGHEKVSELDAAASGRLMREALEADDLGRPDVAFEFTAPAAAERHLRALLRVGIPVVCGTTGWELGPELRSALVRSPSGTVVSPNYSVGMALFRALVREAGRRVSAAGLHRPWIFEAHHTGKADAPSGTARELARILREVDPRLESVCEGNPTGALPDGALHVVSLRAGSEPGTHTVGFEGEHDRITLTHGARSRSGFAIGAVLAAEWIRGRPGLHEFDEVVGDLG